jgi:hypothetical protein
LDFATATAPGQVCDTSEGNRIRGLSLNFYR